MLRWIAFGLAVGCAIIGAMLLWTVMARAEGCLPLPAAELEMREYGEKLWALGLSTNGFITRFYLNQDKGTWTLFHVRPDGMACAIDDGIAFEPVRQVVPGQKT